MIVVPVGPFNKSQRVHSGSENSRRRQRESGKACAYYSVICRRRRRVIIMINGRSACLRRQPSWRASFKPSPGGGGLSVASSLESEQIIKMSSRVGGSSNLHLSSRPERSLNGGPSSRSLGGRHKGSLCNTVICFHLVLVVSALVVVANCKPTGKLSSTLNRFLRQDEGT